MASNSQELEAGLKLNIPREVELSGRYTRLTLDTALRMNLILLSMIAPTSIRLICLETARILSVLRCMNGSAFIRCVKTSAMRSV